MPTEIRLEPIPLTQILTDIFQKEGPDIGDIGLYFYPADAVNRHIAKYSALVQLMVSQEYAMRGLVNGAELLLFTSKELHADSHLFIAGLQSEYFLWGIFYSAKSTLACKSLHEELDVHPPLSVVDHSNNGHPISNKSSTIDSITGIDELSRNASNGGSISHEEGTIDEIALPRTDFVESFQEHAQDVVMPPAAANYTCSSLIETTLNVKIEDTCSELVGSSSGVETPKQSNQQVNFEVQEITSDKHDIIKRSSKLPSKIEKPDKKVGSPKQGCSFRNWVKLNTSGITGGSTGSSGAGGVEAPKQSDQQVKVEVQEITSNKHDVVERSPKLPPKIEKPNEKVGLPEQSCSFRNWVKLNTSGITRGSTGSAGVGGTVHTSSGKWVLGYSFQLGKWSSLAADLWAIFQGLNLVWDRNYRKVLVLSDSYPALNSLKTAPQASDPNKDLIQCCRELILRNWECNVSHISREKNAAAAWLADHSQLYPMGLTKLDEPPQELAHILKNQDNGISPPS
ncbi:hypothetical protein ACJRO7_009770 [Eucalyptus globulus]|uniref:RNase H type-1 domain-containing protein n=1 Tax=Eucalyptus globulus TaxID=34317 RepID=A0ABD3LEQ7_EUCGL